METRKVTGKSGEQNCIPSDLDQPTTHEMINEKEYDSTIETSTALGPKTRGTRSKDVTLSPLSSQKTDESVNIRNKKAKKKSPAKVANQIKTRKSAAMDLASCSRITRARRNSTGRIEVQKEKRKYTRKTIAAISSPLSSLKRKRVSSIKSEIKDDENEAKIIKTEPKDEDPENSKESFYSTQGSTDNKDDNLENVETITVKQEPFEVERSPCPSEIKSTSSDVENQGRLRRISTRILRSSSPAVQSAPSTPELGAKRKKASKFVKAEDDDEFDTQSYDLSMDSKEYADTERAISEVTAEENSFSALFNDCEKLATPSKIDCLEESDDQEDMKTVPLLDVPELAREELDEHIPSSSAASNGPSQDISNERLCEISVKQFYKRPEFLENNLGIENDPKLGEIVQEVEKTVVEYGDSASDQVDKKIDPALDDLALEANIQLENKCDSIEEIKPEENTAPVYKADTVAIEFPEPDKEEHTDLVDKANANEANEEICNEIETEETNDVEIKPTNSEDNVGMENTKEDSFEENILNDSSKEGSSVIPAINTPETVKEYLVGDNQLQDDYNPLGEDQDLETTPNPCDPENKIEEGENIMQQEDGEEEQSLLKEDDFDDNLEHASTQNELQESPESFHEKELHLKTLGLLTVRAAHEAGVANEKRRQLLKVQSSEKKACGQQEYTGTLKTVIKLNRQTSNPVKNNSNIDGKKIRQSLKMTFQKGRNRGTNADKDDNSKSSADHIYYTIQNEAEEEQNKKNSNKTLDDSNASTSTENTDNGGKKEDVVIPEKASSFSIHPGRLCQDQCYYCGGKFGLYDTPCHVAQIKSMERQTKILQNEEKLLVDNCLCDACFRHVDRRANAPSYKRNLNTQTSIEPSTDSKLNPVKPNVSAVLTPNTTVCFVPECTNLAAHSMRRKCIRKQVKKLLLNFDMSSLGAYVHICAKHYEAVVQFLGCALCKRRLGKAHVFHINTDVARLENLLSRQGIPVVLKENSGVCKLCRYFTNLLLKPPENGKSQKAEFVKNYRKRLLQFHNVQSNEQSENELDNSNLDSSQEKIKRTKKPKKAASNGGAYITSPVPSNDSSVEEISDTEDQTNSKSCQMVLDNDVLVDYDIPVTSESESASNEISPQSRLRSILQNDNYRNDDTISSVLRSNPNISMRELFPGEEDLGLQVKIPFGSSKFQQTPEGWTKVETILQYDESTRALWEDLQKPYGNQSSFLRHLILLEKYYRNGDLVLSTNASSNAVTYSESTQNRLRSYDHKPTQKKSSLSEDKSPTSCREITIEKIPNSLNNNSVTITARPKEAPKLSKTPSELSISNLGCNKDNAVEIVAIVAPAETKKCPKTLDVETQQVAKKTANSSGIPPELISIQKRQGMPSQNKRMAIAQVSKASTSKAIPPNVIVLSDSLSFEERQASKYWRPTLMPVTPGTNLNNQGPLYQTADGRRLPALVQVQSGGQPFLISIHDYNRMCILRREKLLRDQIMKNNKGKVSLNPGSITIKDVKGSVQLSASGHSTNKKTANAPIAAKSTGSKNMNINGKQHYMSAESHATFSNIQNRPKAPSATAVPNKNTNLTKTHPLPWTWNSAGAGSGQSQLFSNNIVSNGSNLVLDNNLLSKIPKSLTVIPQKKLLPSSTVTSASLAAASSSGSVPMGELARRSIDGFN